MSGAFEERKPPATMYERTSGLANYASLRALLDKARDDETLVRLTFGGNSHLGKVLRLIGPILWFQQHREERVVVGFGLPRGPVGEPVAIAIDHIVAIQESHVEE